MKQLAPWAIVAALAAPAAAQTNDHIFRSWRLTTPASDPRATALGGAVAALEDDAAAAVTNPGALASLTKSEGKLSLRNLGKGTSDPGDRLQSGTTPALGVFGWRVSGSVVVAAYFAEPYKRGLALNLSLPDGFTATGALEGSVIDLGLTASWRARPWLFIGARGALSRLALDGTYAHEPPSGLADLEVETSARNTQPTGTLGVLLLPSARLRLALTAASGAAFSVARSAESPALGVVLQSNGRYEIRAPRVFTAAVGFHPSRRLTLLGQIDRVEYADTRSGLTIGQGAHARSEYALDSGWEPRAGVEWSLPYRTFSIQLRAGVHGAAPGLLHYGGDDEVEAAVFTGEGRRVVPTAGLSVVTARWLRFEVGARFDERTEIVVGAAARF